jgi:hypothetical protein
MILLHAYVPDYLKPLPMGAVVAAVQSEILRWGGDDKCWNEVAENICDPRATSSIHIEEIKTDRIGDYARVRVINSKAYHMYFVVNDIRASNSSFAIAVCNICKVTFLDETLPMNAMPSRKRFREAQCMRPLKCPR